MAVPDRKNYGLTGEVSKDGLLTPDQQFTLNRIQDEASEAASVFLSQRKEGDRYPLVAMATGIGKGRIISLALERQFSRKKDSQVLVIAGTKNILVHQTHAALEGYQRSHDQIVFNDPNKQTIIFNDTRDEEDEYTDLEDSDELNDETEDISGDETLEYKSFSYKTGKLSDPTANVKVATIQMVQSALRRNTLNPKDYDLVVIDEVHNIGTPQRVSTVEQFDQVIGFTATPHRSSGRKRSPGEYGFKIVESLPLPEAQELRLLPPLIGMQIDTKDIIDEIPLKRNGQINYAKLERLLKANPDLRPYIVNKIAPLISQEGRNYKTVIAVNYVWEAQEIAELLEERGIKVGVAVNEQAAKVIDSPEIPAIDSIERYKLPSEDANAIQVLISPYVASEGFDAPFTEVLVWASPTDSALRYTQYTGRLARRAEGKRFGVVVDCLYQTNQYNWSYNMGMWMKGNVTQLENGLLYLGPEQDIESLRMNPLISEFILEGDKKNFRIYRRKQF